MPEGMIPVLPCGGLTALCSPDTAVPASILSFR